MANPEHLAILKQGVEVWNRWMEPGIHLPDLSDADFSGEDLTNIKFGAAELSGANLSSAELYLAEFMGATLEGTDLAGARLRRAQFVGAILCKADFRMADLSCAIFDECHLESANFSGAELVLTTFSNCRLDDLDLSGAILRETIFADIDLSSVRGLQACLHQGPCVLDHRTLQQSGSLPLPFLRGCGLPDGLIGYLPSIFSQSAEFASCFISYSTLDQEFANRLYASKHWSQVLVRQP